jgi:hypothetical protein
MPTSVLLIKTSTSHHATERHKQKAPLLIYSVAMAAFMQGAIGEASAMPRLGYLREQIEQVCGKPTVGPVSYEEFIKDTMSPIDMALLMSQKDGSNERQRALLDQAMSLVIGPPSGRLSSENPLAAFSPSPVLYDGAPINFAAAFVAAALVPFLQSSKLQLAAYNFGDYSVGIAFATDTSFRETAVAIVYVRARPITQSSTTGGLIPRKTITQTPPITEEEILSLLSANGEGEAWQVQKSVSEAVTENLFGSQSSGTQERSPDYTWVAENRGAAWDGDRVFAVALRPSVANTAALRQRNSADKDWALASSTGGETRNGFLEELPGTWSYLGFLDEGGAKARVTALVEIWNDDDGSIVVDFREAKVVARGRGRMVGRSDPGEVWQNTFLLRPGGAAVGRSGDNFRGWVEQEGSWTEMGNVLKCSTVSGPILLRRLMWLKNLDVIQEFVESSSGVRWSGEFTRVR